MITIYINNFDNILDICETEQEYEDYMFFQVSVVIECLNEKSEKTLREFYNTLTLFEKCIIGTLAKQIGLTTHVYYKYNNYLYLYDGLSQNLAKQMCKKIEVDYNQSVYFSQYFKDLIGMLNEKIQLQVIDYWIEHTFENMCLSKENYILTDYKEYMTCNMFLDAFKDGVAISLAIRTIFYDTQYLEIKEKWIYFLKGEIKKIKVCMAKYPKIADIMPGIMPIKEVKASELLHWNAVNKNMAKEIWEEIKENKNHLEEIKNIIAIHKKYSLEEKDYLKAIAIAKDGSTYDITKIVNDCKNNNEKIMHIIKKKCYARKMKVICDIKDFIKIKQRFENGYKYKEVNPLSYTNLEEVYAINQDCMNFVYAKWDNGIDCNTNDAVPFIKIFSEVIYDI